MINLIRNVLLSGCLVLLSSCATTPKSPELCVERALAVEVVRLDARNKRFFIVGDESVVEKISENRNVLNSCFSKHVWFGVWSLSLFSEKKYAGYQDEDAIIPFHANNLWSKAYIAEYDRESNTLTTSPALSPVEINF